MPTVININRQAAIEWRYTPENTIWVSISEPKCDDTIVHNPVFNSIPQLKIAFWDVTKQIKIVGQDELVEPPTEFDAKSIVDFILSHKGKNVIVNCAAGISRSGAVARFCHDELGYKWPESEWRDTRPNKLLLELMTKYYRSIKSEDKAAKIAL